METRKIEAINLKLTPAQKEKIKELSKKEGMDMTSWIISKLGL